MIIMSDDYLNNEIIQETPDKLLCGNVEALQSQETVLIDENDFDEGCTVLKADLELKN